MSQSSTAVWNHTIQRPTKRGQFWVMLFSVFALLGAILSIVYMFVDLSYGSELELIFIICHAGVIIAAAILTMVCMRAKQKLFPPIGMVMVLQIYDVICVIGNIGLYSFQRHSVLNIVLDAVVLMLVFLMYRICLLQTNVPVKTDTKQCRNPKLLVVCLIPVILQLASILNQFSRMSYPYGTGALAEYIFHDMAPISFFVLLAVSIAVCNSETTELPEDAYYVEYGQAPFIAAYVAAILAPVIEMPSTSFVFIVAVLMISLISSILNFLISKIGRGGVKGAVVGGILFGWVGAVVGAILGKGK